MNKNTKNNSVEDSHVVKPQGGETELTTPTGSEPAPWTSTFITNYNPKEHSHRVLSYIQESLDIAGSRPLLVQISTRPLETEISDQDLVQYLSDKIGSEGISFPKISEHEGG